MKDKSTLVIGASTNPKRYSNMAIHALLKNQVPVVAFGIREGEVEGVRISTSIPDENFHTITLYLNPTRQQEYYDDILRLNPKRVIFNPGTENPDFYEVLKGNNIEFIEACTLVMLSIGNF